MIRKITTLTIVAISSFIFSSCTPSTPQTRIQQNPTSFASLSKEHQKLAEKGQVKKGMPKKAVYFAWGTPSNSISGSRNGADFERWNYKNYTPVYTNSFYGNYGYGFSRRHYRRPYSAIGFSPQVRYIPRHSASVEFRNDKVINWERRQR